MLPFYTPPVFNIPAGPKNLSALGINNIWQDTEEYYIEVIDSGNQPLFQTNTYKTGCCCSEERLRLIFRNFAGFFDGINFDPPRIIHENESSEYKKPLPTTRVIYDSTTERFNIRSNESYECVTNCYGEEHMNWLMELVDSGKAFIEWKGIQGQSDSYLPIRILDSKQEKKKIADEWYYLFRLQFKLSNENITQR